MTPMPPSRVDPVEMGRPYEQPIPRFGAKHSIPVENYDEFIDVRISDELGLNAERETFAPSRAIEVSPEVYIPEEVASAIEGCAAHDIEAFGIPALLDIEFAADKALEAYGVCAADTAFPVEQAVAEYFAALTNIALDAETVTDDDVEEMIVAITRFLKDADELETHLLRS